MSIQPWIPSEFSWLYDVLVGQSWPQANEDGLRASAQYIADTMVKLITQENANVGMADLVGYSVQSASAESFANFFQQYLADDNSPLGQQLRSLEQQAELLLSNANETAYTKISMNIQVAATALVLLALAASAWWNPAAGPEAAFYVRSGQLAVKILSNGLLDAVLMMLAPDVAGQAYEMAQGRQASWDWGKTANAAAMAGVGALFGMLADPLMTRGLERFVPWMGRTVPESLAGRTARVATHLASHFVLGGTNMALTSMVVQLGTYGLYELTGDTADIQRMDQNGGPFGNLGHAFVSGGWMGALFALPHVRSWLQGPSSDVAVPGPAGPLPPDPLRVAAIGPDGGASFFMRVRPDGGTEFLGPDEHPMTTAPDPTGHVLFMQGGDGSQKVFYAAPNPDGSVTMQQVTSVERGADGSVAFKGPDGEVLTTITPSPANHTAGGGPTTTQENPAANPTSGGGAPSEPNPAATPAGGAPTPHGATPDANRPGGPDQAASGPRQPLAIGAPPSSSPSASPNAPAGPEGPGAGAPKPDTVQPTPAGPDPINPSPTVGGPAPVPRAIDGAPAPVPIGGVHPAGGAGTGSPAVAPSTAVANPPVGRAGGVAATAPTTGNGLVPGVFPARLDQPVVPVRDPLYLAAAVNMALQMQAPAAPAPIGPSGGPPATSGSALPPPPAASSTANGPGSAAVAQTSTDAAQPAGQKQQAGENQPPGAASEAPDAGGPTTSSARSGVPVEDLPSAIESAAKAGEVGRTSTARVSLEFGGRTVELGWNAEADLAGGALRLRQVTVRLAGPEAGGPEAGGPEAGGPADSAALVPDRLLYDMLVREAGVRGFQRIEVTFDGIAGERLPTWLLAVDPVVRGGDEVPAGAPRPTDPVPSAVADVGSGGAGAIAASLATETETAGRADLSVAALLEGGDGAGWTTAEVVVATTSAPVASVGDARREVSGASGGLGPPDDGSQGLSPTGPRKPAVSAGEGGAGAPPSGGGGKPPPGGPPGGNGDGPSGPDDGEEPGDGPAGSSGPRSRTTAAPTDPRVLAEYAEVVHGLRTDQGRIAELYDAVTAAAADLADRVAASDEALRAAAPPATVDGRVYEHIGDPAYYLKPVDPRHPHLGAFTISSDVLAARGLAPGDFVRLDDPRAHLFLREAHIGRLLRQWEATANSVDPKSLALQEATRREFGLTDTYQWPMDDALRVAVDGELTAHGGVYRELVRAQYDATQEYLRRHGVADLVLYRGMSWTGESPPEWALREPGATVEPPAGRPLASWSSRIRDAEDFARPGSADHGVVLSATVPAGRILSMSRTGFGDFYSAEVVVLGGQGEATLGRPGQAGHAVGGGEGGDGAGTGSDGPRGGVGDGAQAPEPTRLSPGLRGLLDVEQLGDRTLGSVSHAFRDDGADHVLSIPAQRRPGGLGEVDTRPARGAITVTPDQLQEGNDVLQEAMRADRTVWHALAFVSSFEDGGGGTLVVLHGTPDAPPSPPGAHVLIWGAPEGASDPREATWFAARTLPALRDSALSHAYVRVPTSRTSDPRLRLVTRDGSVQAAVSVDAVPTVAVEHLHAVARFDAAGRAWEAITQAVDRLRPLDPRLEEATRHADGWDEWNAVNEALTRAVAVPDLEELYGRTVTAREEEDFVAAWNALVPVPDLTSEQYDDLAGTLAVMRDRAVDLVSGLADEVRWTHPAAVAQAEDGARVLQHLIEGTPPPPWMVVSSGDRPGEDPTGPSGLSEPGLSGDDAERAATVIVEAARRGAWFFDRGRDLSGLASDIRADLADPGRLAEALRTAPEAWTTEQRALLERFRSHLDHWLTSGQPEGEGTSERRPEENGPEGHGPEEGGRDDGPRAAAGGGTPPTGPPRRPGSESADPGDGDMAWHLRQWAHADAVRDVETWTRDVGGPWESVLEQARQLDMSGAEPSPERVGALAGSLLDLDHLFVAGFDRTHGLLPAAASDSYAVSDDERELLRDLVARTYDEHRYTPEDLAGLRRVFAAMDAEYTRVVDGLRARASMLEPSLRSRLTDIASVLHEAEAGRGIDTARRDALAELPSLLEHYASALSDMPGSEEATLAGYLGDDLARIEDTAAAVERLGQGREITDDERGLVRDLRTSIDELDVLLDRWAARLGIPQAASEPEAGDTSSASDDGDGMAGPSREGDGRQAGAPEGERHPAGWAAGGGGDSGKGGARGREADGPRDEPDRPEMSGGTGLRRPEQGPGSALGDALRTQVPVEDFDALASEAESDLTHPAFGLVVAEAVERQWAESSRRVHDVDWSPGGVEQTYLAVQDRWRAAPDAAHFAAIVPAGIAAEGDRWVFGSMQLGESSTGLVGAHPYVIMRSASSPAADRPLPEELRLLLSGPLRALVVVFDGRQGDPPETRLLSRDGSWTPITPRDLTISLLPDAYSRALDRFRALYAAWNAARRVRPLLEPLIHPSAAGDVAQSRRGDLRQALGGAVFFVSDVPGLASMLVDEGGRGSIDPRSTVNFAGGSPLEGAQGHRLVAAINAIVSSDVEAAARQSAARLVAGRFATIADSAIPLLDLAGREVVDTYPVAPDPSREAEEILTARYGSAAPIDPVPERRGEAGDAAGVTTHGTEWASLSEENPYLLPQAARDVLRQFDYSSLDPALRPLRGVSAELDHLMASLVGASSADAPRVIPVPEDVVERQREFNAQFRALLARMHQISSTAYAIAEVRSVDGQSALWLHLTGAEQIQMAARGGADVLVRTRTRSLNAPEPVEGMWDPGALRRSPGSSLPFQYVVSPHTTKVFRVSREARSGFLETRHAVVDFGDAELSLQPLDRPGRPEPLSSLAMEAPIAPAGLRRALADFGRALASGGDASSSELRSAVGAVALTHPVTRDAIADLAAVLAAVDEFVPPRADMTHVFGDPTRGPSGVSGGSLEGVVDDIPLLAQHVKMYLTARGEDERAAQMSATVDDPGLGRAFRWLRRAVDGTALSDGTTAHDLRLAERFRSQVERLNLDIAAHDAQVPVHQSVGFDMPHARHVIADRAAALEAVESGQVSGDALDALLRRTDPGLRARASDALGYVDYLTTSGERRGEDPWAYSRWSGDIGRNALDDTVGQGPTLHTVQMNAVERVVREGVGLLDMPGMRSTVPESAGLADSLRGYVARWEAVRTAFTDRREAWADLPPGYRDAYAGDDSTLFIDLRRDLLRLNDVLDGRGDPGDGREPTDPTPPAGPAFDTSDDAPRTGPEAGRGGGPAVEPDGRDGRGDASARAPRRSSGSETSPASASPVPGADGRLTISALLSDPELAVVDEAVPRASADTPGSDTQVSYTPGSYTPGSDTQGSDTQNGVDGAEGRSHRTSDEGGQASTVPADGPHGSGGRSGGGAGRGGRGPRRPGDESARYGLATPTEPRGEAVDGERLPHAEQTGQHGSTGADDGQPGEPSSQRLPSHEVAAAVERFVAGAENAPAVGPTRPEVLLTVRTGGDAASGIPGREHAAVVGYRVARTEVNRALADALRRLRESPLDRSYAVVQVLDEGGRLEFFRLVPDVDEAVSFTPTDETMVAPRFDPGDDPGDDGGESGTRGPDGPTRPGGPRDDVPPEPARPGDPTGTGGTDGTQNTDGAPNGDIGEGGGSPGEPQQATGRDTSPASTTSVSAVEPARLRVPWDEYEALALKVESDLLHQAFGLLLDEDVAQHVRTLPSDDAYRQAWERWFAVYQAWSAARRAHLVFQPSDDAGAPLGGETLTPGEAVGAAVDLVGNVPELAPMLLDQGERRFVDALDVVASEGDTSWDDAAAREQAVRAVATRFATIEDSAAVLLDALAADVVHTYETAHTGPPPGDRGTVSLGGSPSYQPLPDGLSVGAPSVGVPSVGAPSEGSDDGTGRRRNLVALALLDADAEPGADPNADPNTVPHAVPTENSLSPEGTPASGRTPGGAGRSRIEALLGADTTEAQEPGRGQESPPSGAPEPLATRGGGDAERRAPSESRGSSSGGGNDGGRPPGNRPPGGGPPGPPDGPSGPEGNGPEGREPEPVLYTSMMSLVLPRDATALVTRTGEGVVVFRLGRRGYLVPVTRASILGERTVMGWRWSARLPEEFAGNVRPAAIADWPDQRTGLLNQVDTAGIDAAGAETVYVRPGSGQVEGYSVRRADGTAEYHRIVRNGFGGIQPERPGDVFDGDAALRTAIDHPVRAIAWSDVLAAQPDLEALRRMPDVVPSDWVPLSDDTGIVAWGDTHGNVYVRRETAHGIEWEVRSALPPDLAVPERGVHEGLPARAVAEIDAFVRERIAARDVSSLVVSEARGYEGLPVAFRRPDRNGTFDVLRSDPRTGQVLGTEHVRNLPDAPPFRTFRYEPAPLPYEFVGRDAATGRAVAFWNGVEGQYHAIGYTSRTGLDYEVSIARPEPTGDVVWSAPPDAVVERVDDLGRPALFRLPLPDSALTHAAGTTRYLVPEFSDEGRGTAVVRLVPHLTPPPDPEAPPPYADAMMSLVAMPADAVALATSTGEHLAWQLATGEYVTPIRHGSGRVRAWRISADRPDELPRALVRVPGAEARDQPSRILRQMIADGADRVLVRGRLGRVEGYRRRVGDTIEYGRIVRDVSGDYTTVRYTGSERDAFRASLPRGTQVFAFDDVLAARPDFAALRHVREAVPDGWTRISDADGVRALRDRHGNVYVRRETDHGTAWEVHGELTEGLVLGLTDGTLHTGAPDSERTHAEAYVRDNARSLRRSSVVRRESDGQVIALRRPDGSYDLLRHDNLDGRVTGTVPVDELPGGEPVRHEPNPAWTPLYHPHSGDVVGYESDEGGRGRGRRVHIAITEDGRVVGYTAQKARRGSVNEPRQAVGAVHFEELTPSSHLATAVDQATGHRWFWNGVKDQYRLVERNEVTGFELNTTHTRDRPTGDLAWTPGDDWVVERRDKLGRVVLYKSTVPEWSVGREAGRTRYFEAKYTGASDTIVDLIAYNRMPPDPWRILVPVLELDEEHGLPPSLFMKPDDAALLVPKSGRDTRFWRHGPSRYVTELRDDQKRLAGLEYSPDLPVDQPRNLRRTRLADLLDQQGTLLDRMVEVGALDLYVDPGTGTVEGYRVRVDGANEYRRLGVDEAGRFTERAYAGAGEFRATLSAEARQVMFADVLLRQPDYEALRRVPEAIPVHWERLSDPGRQEIIGYRDPKTGIFYRREANPAKARIVWKIYNEPPSDVRTLIDDGTLVWEETASVKTFAHAYIHDTAGLFPHAALVLSEHPDHLGEVVALREPDGSYRVFVHDERSGRLDKMVHVKELPAEPRFSAFQVEAGQLMEPQYNDEDGELVGWVSYTARTPGGRGFGRMEHIPVYDANRKIVGLVSRKAKEGSEDSFARMRYSVPLRTFKPRDHEAVAISRDTGTPVAAWDGEHVGLLRFNRRTDYFLGTFHLGRDARLPDDVVWRPGESWVPRLDLRTGNVRYYQARIRRFGGEDVVRYFTPVIDPLLRSENQTVRFLVSDQPPLSAAGTEVLGSAEMAQFSAPSTWVRHVDPQTGTLVAFQNGDRYLLPEVRADGSLRWRTSGALPDGLRDATVQWMPPEPLRGQGQAAPSANGGGADPLWRGNPEEWAKLSEFERFIVATVRGEDGRFPSRWAKAVVGWQLRRISAFGERPDGALGIMRSFNRMVVNWPYQLATRTRFTDYWSTPAGRWERWAADRSVSWLRPWVQERIDSHLLRTIADLPRRLTTFGPTYGLSWGRGYGWTGSMVRTPEGERYAAVSITDPAESMTWGNIVRTYYKFWWPHSPVGDRFDYLNNVPHINELFQKLGLKIGQAGLGAGFHRYFLDVLRWRKTYVGDTRLLAVKLNPWRGSNPEFVALHQPYDPAITESDGFVTTSDMPGIGFAPLLGTAEWFDPSHPPSWLPLDARRLWPRLVTLPVNHNDWAYTPWYFYLRPYLDFGINGRGAGVWDLIKLIRQGPLSAEEGGATIGAPVVAVEGAFTPSIHFNPIRIYRWLHPWIALADLPFFFLPPGMRPLELVESFVDHITGHEGWNATIQPGWNPEAAFWFQLDSAQGKLELSRLVNRQLGDLFKPPESVPPGGGSGSLSIPQSAASWPRELGRNGDLLALRDPSGNGYLLPAFSAETGAFAGWEFAPQLSPAVEARLAPRPDGLTGGTPPASAHQPLANGPREGSGPREGGGPRGSSHRVSVPAGPVHVSVSGSPVDPADVRGRSVLEVASALDIRAPEAVAAMARGYDVVHEHSAPLMVKIAHDMLVDLQAQIAADPNRSIVFVGRDAHSIALGMRELAPEFFAAHAVEIVLSRALAESALQDVEQSTGRTFPELGAFREARDKVDLATVPGALRRLTEYLRDQGIPVGEPDSHVILVDTSYKGTIQEILSAVYPETSFSGMLAFYAEHPADPHPGSKRGYALDLRGPDAMGAVRTRTMPQEVWRTFSHWEALSAFEELHNGPLSSTRRIAGGRPVQSPIRYQSNPLDGLNHGKVAPEYTDPVVREAVKRTILLAVRDYARWIAAIRESGGDYQTLLDQGADRFVAQLRAWITGTGGDPRFTTLADSFVRRVDYRLASDLADAVTGLGMSDEDTTAVWEAYDRLTTEEDKRAFVAQFRRNP